MSTRKSATPTATQNHAHFLDGISDRPVFRVAAKQGVLTVFEDNPVQRARFSGILRVTFVASHRQDKLPFANQNKISSASASSKSSLWSS